MKPTIKTYIRLLFLVVGVIFLAEAQSADVVERYTLLEDKFRTVEMLRAPGHDFFIDISAWLNADVQDVIDEAEQAANTPGDTTAKLNAATAFLNKYNKTEQTLRINVDFGIPIFSFTAWGIKFVPDFRFGFNLGFHLGIEAQTFTFSQIVDLVGQDIPQGIKSKLLACGETNLSNGDNNGDIMLNFVDHCGGTAEENAIATANQGKYFYPGDPTVPNLFPYVKGEGHAGFLVNWMKGENWFGHVKLYALGRSDMALRVTAETLANNKDTIELPDEPNLTVNATSDLQVGYTKNNMTGFVAINEIKIATVTDNKDKGGEVNYGFDPLIRLHGEYEMELAFFDFKPFVGVHKRKAYGLSDGLYGGAELGAYVWEDRLGLMLRGMVDTEHITLTPRAKLWFAQLEYNLKLPVKSEVDGVKPSTLHSLNFRLFF